MHLLKKEILFFLSLLILFGNCKEETTEEQPVAEIDYIAKFMDNLFSEKDLTSEETEQFIKTIDSINNGINGFTVYNDIEPGKVLFTTKSDSLLTPFISRLNSTFDKPIKFESYQVWEKNDTFDYEISLSPHPVEDWMLMIRE